jgi:hypothetical protein
MNWRAPLLWDWPLPLLQWSLLVRERLAALP